MLPPTSNNTNNPAPNETDSSSESSESSESSASSSQQPQRRSARLMKRQRDNEDNESNSRVKTEEMKRSAGGAGSNDAICSGSDGTIRSERTRTANTRNTVNTTENTRNTTETISNTTNGSNTTNTSNTGPTTNTTTSANRTTTNRTATATATATATTATSTTATRTNTTNFPLPPGMVPMPIVFSIGISRAPQSAASSGLPPDIHWVFNTGGNPSAEELQELIRNSSTGGRGLRSTSVVFPLVPPASTATRSGARASTNPTAAASPAEADQFDPLNFARQMFQLIARVRSTPASPTAAQAASEAVEFPLREFLGNIVNLMNSGNANEGSDDLESMLNDFITRVFGNTEAIPAGLTPERINALPLMEGTVEFDCAICRETARAGAAEKCVKLPCDHGFHFDCIEPWLKRVSSCPICRGVIKEEE